MSHKLSILIISGGREDAGSASILAMNRLDEAIKSLGYQTLLATTPGDGKSLVKSYHGFGCVILDWDLPGVGSSCQRAAGDILCAIRNMDRRLPIFLIADKTQIQDIPLDIVKEVSVYLPGPGHA